MKIRLVVVCILLLVSNVSVAQNAHFTNSGTIEYEKLVNTYAAIKNLYGKRMDDAFFKQALELYEKNQPQFKVYKSTLTFINNKSLFVPVAYEGNISSIFSNVPGSDQNNTIYSDRTTNTGILQKKVFEQTFLLKDSLRRIKWKITGETREVAGYTCRRANGLMMDSVYVVAFYTDEIPLPGGPESFGGLPGMILEVALPHENISWHATKVTDTVVPETGLVPPKTGKPITNKQLLETLRSVLKDYDDQEQVKLIIKGYLL